MVDICSSDRFFSECNTEFASQQTLLRGHICFSHFPCFKSLSRELSNCSHLQTERHYYRSERMMVFGL